MPQFTRSSAATPGREAERSGGSPPMAAASVSAQGRVVIANHPRRAAPPDVRSYLSRAGLSFVDPVCAWAAPTCRIWTTSVDRTLTEGTSRQESIGLHLAECGAFESPLGESSCPSDAPLTSSPTSCVRSSSARRIAPAAAVRRRGPMPSTCSRFSRQTRGPSISSAHRSRVCSRRIRSYAPCTSIFATFPRWIGRVLPACARPCNGWSDDAFRCRCVRVPRA